jgi:thiol-disulfide isomerase/thioredoxin
MKLIKLFLVLTLAHSLHIFGSEKKIESIKLDQYPKSSKKVSTYDFNDGKTYVLNFWAVWCTSCIQEIPLLNKLKEKYGNEKFIYLAINAGDTEKKIDKFLTKYPFHFEHLLDMDKKYSKSVGVTNLPVTIVIKNKKIVFEGIRPPAKLDF